MANADSKVKFLTRFLISVLIQAYPISGSQVRRLPHCQILKGEWARCRITHAEKVSVSEIVVQNPILWTEPTLKESGHSGPAWTSTLVPAGICNL